MVIAAAIVFAGALAAAAAPHERPGWLGFGFAYASEVRDDGRVRGWFVVHRIAPGGPAEKGGLQPHDVIVAIEGEPLTFSNDVQALERLAKIQPRQRVVLRVRRGTVTRTIALVAAPMSDEQHARWKRNFEAAKRTLRTGRPASARR